MKHIDGCALALALVDVAGWKKTKKLFETYTSPEGVYLAHTVNTLSYLVSLFFETLVMFSIRIQLSKSLNKAECIK